VLVRYDSSASVARLLLRDSTSREWAVGRVPAPATRIYWLDHPAVDSLTRRALSRAFDESALYDEAVRSASVRGRTRDIVTRLTRDRRPSTRKRVFPLRHRA
jgi:hypothetical protein